MSSCFGGSSRAFQLPPKSQCAGCLLFPTPFLGRNEPHVAEPLLPWKSLSVCCSLTWADPRARTHIPACRNTMALTNLIEILRWHAEVFGGMTDGRGRGVSSGKEEEKSVSLSPQPRGVAQRSRGPGQGRAVLALLYPGPCAPPSPAKGK